MTKGKKLGLALALVLGLGANLAHAEKTEAYATSEKSGEIVKNSFGECWRTGSWTKEQGLVECGDAEKKPEPQPVVEAPAPAPAPAPRYEQTTLAADALFDFNKATLRSAGKQKLNGLVDKLKESTKYDNIIVEGYTDRIGSDAYNLKLSQARANSVKKYLESKGVAGDKITAVGKGKENPVTAGQCKGTKKTKALISCLQPDRRVVIQIPVENKVTVQ